MNHSNAGKACAKDGCQLFYRAYSSPGKARLVLIHSLALDNSFWNGVIGELRRDFEILACDCRGHGHSDRWPGPYSTQLFAEDIAAILDDCGWPAATLAGCSMGGCVAQAFAGAYPERTQAVGLIDTTAWYGPSAQTDWSQRAERAAEAGFAAMIPFQISRWFSDNFVTTHADVVEAASRVFLANDVACYQASCTMLGEADLRGFLGAPRMPASIIVGEEDYATPVAMSESLHAAIPGSSLHVIRGGRHLTPIECPKEIATLLRELAAQTASPVHL